MTEPFSYRLCVLTHSAGGAALAAALEAFEQHSTPAPAEVVVVVDGHEFGYVTQALKGRFDGVQVTIHPGTAQEGFCAATRRAWALAAAGPGPSHVAYLEHDFVLTRDVAWGDLAAVLDANPQLSQMQLMRDAVNAAEKAAGGLFESRPDEYDPRDETTLSDETGMVKMRFPRWHEHTAYVVTTNPSLMRRSFMQEHEWPADLDSNCEGLFGVRLRGLGFSAGVWGDGSPWCSHRGVRNGHGY